MNDILILGNEGADSLESTSYLIDQDLIVDMSIHTYGMLKELNLTKKINKVVITHNHMDHIGGLLSLIIEKSNNNQKLNIVGSSNIKESLLKLSNYDPKIQSILNNENNLIKVTNFKEGQKEPNFLKDRKIKLIDVEHTPNNELPSLGLIVGNDNNKNTVISGDTRKILVPKDIFDSATEEEQKQWTKLNINSSDTNKIIQDVGETNGFGAVHARVEDIPNQIKNLYSAIHVNKKLIETHGNGVERIEKGTLINSLNGDIKVSEIIKNYEYRDLFETNNNYNNIDEEKKILINPSPMFLQNLISEYLENNKQGIITQINHIHFNESYEIDMPDVLELFLVQKRYFEGKRFFTDGTRNELSNSTKNFKLFELGIKITGENNDITSKIRTQSEGFGLSIDGNEDYSIENFKYNNKIILNKTTNKQKINNFNK